MSDVQLEAIYLVNSDFNYGWFRESVFKKSIINGSKFISANLTKYNMESADLKDVDFSQATLKGIIFKNADLTNANISNALMDDQVNFDGSRVKGLICKDVKGLNEEQRLYLKNNGALISEDAVTLKT